MANLKIVLLGPGESGKTAYTRRLCGNFKPSQPYVPTLGVDVHPVYVDTNRGQIVVNLWDTAGQEKYGGLRDGYYIEAHGAIFMLDSKPNSSQVTRMQELTRVCGDSLPVVVTERQPTSLGGKFAAQFHTSRLECNPLCTGEQLVKPLEVLLQKITGDTTLQVLKTSSYSTYPSTQSLAPEFV